MTYDATWVNQADLNTGTVSAGAPTLDVHIGTKGYTDTLVAATSASIINSGITIAAEWKFDIATGASDPGNGKFRLDDVTPQVSASNIYIDDNTDQSVDMGLLISKLTSGDTIYVQERQDSSRALLFEVSGSPTDNTGWWTIPITNGESSGNDIEDKQKCAFLFQYSGSALPHSDLTGLIAPADDHTQYAHIDARRAFTNPVSGATPTLDEHLTTKLYVDDKTVNEIAYNLPLTGVVDIEVDFIGTLRTEDTGATGDVATDWAVSNQHAFLLVNSITGSGTVTISGASLSESTAVTVPVDSETLTVATTGYYQTDKKWWEVINIDIPAGISAINYDYGVVGYPDLGNRNFRILGYRCDAFASGTNPDFRLIIEKVQDDGSKKMSIVLLEDIGVDADAAGDQIIDHLRTSGDDRSYDPDVSDIWNNNTTITFKQLDFNTFFTSNENDIMAADGHEGYIIRIEGEGGGISNVDYITIHLFYELI
jgi:hypothetical protein